MKVTLLGTGTPAPSLTRQSSGYIFEMCGDVVVVDHGPGAHGRLLEAGYKATDVTHFLMTHYHYDHLMDYPRLFLTRWDHGAGKLPPLKVFGPAPLHKINQRFYDSDGAFGLDILARTNDSGSLAIYHRRGGAGDRSRPTSDSREVTAGDVIEGEGWIIKVGPARHTSQMECLSYRLEDEDGSVVYSGDNGGVFEPFVEFAKGADMLIHMNHFLTGTELIPEYRERTGSHMDNAETAKRAGVRMLVLTHMLPLFDEVGVKERMVAEMSEVYDGPIVVGEDLMEVPLKILADVAPD